MDIDTCIDRLTGKDAKDAYAFAQQITEESRASGIWYPCFDRFAALLRHKNSLVRNRALSILAANARWDREGKFDALLDEFLSHVTDVKPITARQCIAALPEAAEGKPALVPRIRAALEQADLSGYPDSMRPLILKDIVAAMQKMEHLNQKKETRMRIIISPAKKMTADTDSFAVDGPPIFLEQAERLKTVLQSMSPKALQAMWKCNDAIAKLNIERLERMDLHRNLTPAVIAYEGIQYRYMAPGVMETAQLDYLREHLRIISGFYGLLRPFDGVTPYRLEMQAKLALDGCRDLYQFWGDRLARQLASETDFVLNLASKECSKAVKPHLPKTVQFVTCVFGELIDGRVIEKGTKCKMARGQMVRWLAENRITNLDSLPAFDQLGYQFWRSEPKKDQTVLFWIQSRKADHYCSQ